MTAPCLVPGPPATTLDSFYFGKPGAMVKFIRHDAGAAAPLSRAEVAHALSSGGTTTTRRPTAKRIYSLSFSAMTPDEIETLMSYYLGSRGAGPFALIDPSYRNQLTTDASTIWAPTGKIVAGAWGVPVGDTALTLDTTVAPPNAGSRIMRWTPVTGHALLTNGTYSGTTLASFAPSTRAVPYLTDQPAVLSVYLRALTGTPTATLGVYGSTAAGGAVVGATAATALSSTAWKRLSVSMGIGALSALTEGLHLGVTAATSAGAILVAAAQIEYGYSGGAEPFVTGLGVPRVTISSGLGSTNKVYWRRDTGMTLSEI